MAAKSPYQGGNRVTVWEIASPVVTVLFTYDKTESTTMGGHPLKETIVLDLVSKINNEALDTHLRTYLRNIDLEPVEQLYEDGTKDVLAGVSASTPTFMCIHMSNAIDSKRKLTIFEGAYTGDTGNFTSAQASLGDHPIQITAIAAQAERTIQAAAVYAEYSDAIATGFVDFVIAENTYGCTFFETSA